MSILILAEHDGQNLTHGTLSTITAAKQLEGELHILIAGSGCGSAAEQTSKFEAVTRVLLADDAAYEHGIAENIAPLIVKLAPDYTHVLAPASFYGKNIMPRAAAVLDTQQISDISAVISEDTFERPIYAGNAIATVKSTDALKLITVRATAFEPATSGSGNAAIETVDCTGDTGQTTFVSEELTKSDRPELTSAEIVISGGRGVGSAEAFQKLEKIADKLGAAIGASRAAVDAGYVPNDYQVGQTGKVVAPNLYIAVGISGAIQHLAGMKDSKVIVAINKDAEAPIFQIADYGLVMDWDEALTTLEEKL